ncbi:TPA: TRAP transporter substrate-binding protein, partial [Escherichia coli]
MLSASQSWAVTLKLSHNQDKSHPVHKAMEFFAKKSK